MKSNKELIKEILTQPAHFANLAEKTEWSDRKRFYNAIKEPICLSIAQRSRYVEGVRDYVKFLMEYYDFIESNLNYRSSFSGYCSINISDYSLDVQQSTIKITLRVSTTDTGKTLSIDNTHKAFSMTGYKKISKAVEELNALLLTHTHKSFKSALADFLATQSAEVEKNRLVKQQTNLIKSINDQYYVYFTHTSHAEHYIALSEKERLNSCMSKDYGYFGLNNGQTKIHPLMGYSYAPDFALALVSKLSPSELAELAEQDNPDYPFIARSIVFTGSEDNPVHFARIYGDEICRNSFFRHFHRVDKPIDLQLYAVRVTTIACQTLERMEDDHNNIAEALNNYFYESDHDFYYEPNSFLAVPYIDEYANSMSFSHNPSPLLFERDERDGLEKVLVTTNEGYCESDNMKEQTFGVFHSYGLAFAHDNWDHLDGLIYQDTDNQVRIYWDRD